MTNISINLNAKLQPMHRHDLEDALQETLSKLDFEVEVTGGGTAQEPNGEIASCDIELSISDKSDETINKIKGVMEFMLAPVGSKITIYPENENDKTITIPIGTQQGLGLYLNGKDLDDEVYKNYDINFIYEEIERLLGDFKTGHIASYWEGEETSLYLYGESFEEMHSKIKPLLDEYPLCEKCRVVRIA